MDHIENELTKIKPMETRIEAIIEKLETFITHSDFDALRNKLRHYVPLNDHQKLLEDYNEFRANSIEAHEFRKIKVDLSVL